MRTENILSVRRRPNESRQVATAAGPRGQLCRVARPFDTDSTLVQRSVAQVRRDVSTLAQPAKLLGGEPLHRHIVTTHRRRRGSAPQCPEKLLIAIRLQRLDQLRSRRLALDGQRPQQRRCNNCIAVVELIGSGVQAAREDVEIAHSPEFVADPFELLAGLVDPRRLEERPKRAEYRRAPDGLPHAYRGRRPGRRCHER